tara:strand:- start:13 stop:969 length:957 start_codon:yes stop_codon:yes gene_type:complete
MKLSAKQFALYRRYGADILEYHIGHKTLAKISGHTRHCCNRVVNYAREHGAPNPEDAPGGNILVIGDAHSQPGIDQSRFTLLGRVIEDRCREAMAEGTEFTVVNIGDWADMESLSSYDVAKRSFEGRRYKNDITAAIEAQELMFAEISDAVRKYTRWVLVLGNHEHRINRTTNEDPKLAGFMSVSDLMYEEFGWELYRFKEAANVHGVHFAHYFASGVMGRAIGGANTGRSLILKTLESCVQGHSHILNHTTLTTAAGRRLHGLSVGCFFEHDEGYASTANAMFWRGLCFLNNAKDGDYELETITIKRLRRMYGMELR